MAPGARKNKNTALFETVAKKQGISFFSSPLEGEDSGGGYSSEDDLDPPSSPSPSRGEGNSSENSAVFHVSLLQSPLFTPTPRVQDPHLWDMVSVSTGEGEGELREKLNS